MSLPVIDPVGTGINLKSLIKDSGNTVSDISSILGITDKSTVYKWFRGDTLPGIDNLLALSMILKVPINDMLATK